MENYDDLILAKGQEESAPEQPKEHKTFDKAAYAEKRQQEREAAYALIETTIEKLPNNGELLQTYLDVQARFDRYSVSNVALITAQKPEATKLADFDKWKSLGASVNKGETGIVLLEPGKEYTGGDGSAAVSFNVKKVFDIMQTNAKPEPAPAITRNERTILKALITNVPCELRISNDLPAQFNAQYRPEVNTIYVRQSMDGPDLFRGLSQELALAHMNAPDYKRSENCWAAYCVSYILCKRYGIAVDTYDFNDIPAAYRKMDAKEIRSELTKICKVSNDITNQMNRVMEDLQKKPKERDDGAR